MLVMGWLHVESMTDIECHFRGYEGGTPTSFTCDRLLEGCLGCRVMGGMEAGRRQGGGRRRSVRRERSLQPSQTAATQHSVEQLLGSFYMSTCCARTEVQQVCTAKCCQLDAVHLCGL